ncbi:MAG TPA: fucose isomerase [Rectinemataceae bacterium]|nr:fucose isomerase [Rectinemataceae bacterium]
MNETVTRAVSKPITFGVVVSSRQFFNPAHAVGGRKDVLEALARKGYKAVIGEPGLTADGAVACLADAQKYAELFRDKRDEIDGIIVVLANFGDEIGVVETIRLAGLGVPVLVQACPDELDKLDVRGRRDSFCGKISVCNNLRQYGIPWTDTASHVVGLSTEEFAADLDFFARVCRTVRGLKGARIGSIGARPGAFQTVRYSEKLLQRSGITVVPVDLSEIFAEAEGLRDDDPGVAGQLRTIGAYGSVPTSIQASRVLAQAKFSVVIERWMDENGCDASAIQCWNSIEKNYGCASCLTMSMMGEGMRPSACEVDITGAVSMYALDLASGSPAALLDWNNNYADRPDTVVGTHCSNFPKSFMGTPVEISNLDLLGETFGAENCFGAIKGHVAPGPFTFFRASTDDERGRVKCYAGEGDFTSDPFPMNGGIAVCSIPDARGLMRHITREGFEHHVAMVRGSYAAVLEEAVGRYLGWDLHRHGAAAE